jgi:hypothetical protein
MIKKLHQKAAAQLIGSSQVPHDTNSKTISHFS